MHVTVSQCQFHIFFFSTAELCRVDFRLCCQLKPEVVVYSQRTEMESRGIIFLLFLCLFVNIDNAIELDLTVDIDPGARECFHQYLPQDMEFDIEYQVA